MICTKARNIFGCLLIFSTISCSSIPTSRPIAPTVKLQSVKPGKLSFNKQELAFTLKISNPNPYDLPLKSLSFIAAVDDTEVAQGVSSERVTLPANGDALLELAVSTRLGKMLGQLLLLASDKTAELAYDVSGFIKLANWPVRIPFSTDGTVDGSSLNIQQ